MPNQESQIYLRVSAETKGRWVRQSREEGKKLTDWIIENVEANMKAKDNNFDGAYSYAENWYNRTPKAQLIEWATANGVDIGQGGQILREDWSLTLIDAKTDSIRKAITSYIETETSYDASTVEFTDDEEVTAIKDANKTFNGPHDNRLVVGSISELLEAAGS